MSVDLRERLRRALGTPAPGRAEPVGVAPPPRSAGPGIEDLVDGRFVDTEAGPCFLVETSYSVDHVHGLEPLSGFLNLADRAFACLGRAVGAARPDRSAVLFLDTETTGLAGGTGTYVFMVGAGCFEEDRFVVRQFFMRHHADEPAMLAALDGLLPKFQVIVSFNGKAFDVPLLNTRFVTGRRRMNLRAELHLDLLFPARRLWRHRFESCALGTLEREVLGHIRQSDVPSWMIPELYFRYVRGGDARPMVRVFDHNLHDVLSLVALASRLGARLDDPGSAADDPAELAAIGRLLEDLGYWSDAYACYEGAFGMLAPRATRVAIALRLAALCKRTGRIERALELWSRLVQAGAGGPGPCVELAKYYEHRARDYPRAIEIVQDALTRIDLQDSLGRVTSDPERLDLERRLARLLLKHARRSRGAADASAYCPSVVARRSSG